MSAVYKHITTRPTLNDIFWPEVWQSTKPLAPAITAPLIDGTTVISVIEEEEAITWDEIASRIDELRPDIKTWLISNTNELIATPDDMVFFDPSKTVIDNFLTNPDFSGTRPFYNPFSLTLTTIHTFDSIESLVSHYNTLLPDLTEIFNLSAGINNTIIEEFYNEGVLINKSDLPLV
jgi:hypothetical protein